MEEITLTIKQGTLKGKTKTDFDGEKYYSFLGIPYAKSPVGKLRFKAPQPPEKWEGIRDATKDGSQCYSRNTLFRNVSGSEDCLFLNVFTPEIPNATPNTLKPVMAWIHGGGFNSGSNSSQLYGPEFLITGDVVIVTINYRLGVLGFLSASDSTIGAPGNAALKDMVMALKWIQSNIETFGGDPNNVTIFGQSAGGDAIHCLVLSEMAKGLFHKAIAQSGCALNPWSRGKRFITNLAEELNCPFTEEKDIFNYLQDLPVDKLFEGQEKMLKDRSKGIRLGPIVEIPSDSEPAFLSQDPLDIISKGNYNKVPLMMGYTNNEGIFFLTKPEESKIENLEKFVPLSLQLEKGSTKSLKIADKIKEFYFGDENPNSENIEKSFLLLTDTQFVRDIYKGIKLHSISTNEPLYLYRFSIDAKLNLYKSFAKLNLPGASHGDELGYLFKTIVTPTLSPESIEYKTVRRMVKLWTDFAKTGNPSPVENVSWKAVSKNEINFLNIGEELICSVDPDTERMKFWDEIEAVIH